MAATNKEAKIRWRRGDQIGRGAFCTVYKGLNLDNGTTMAVKEFSIGKSKVENLTREVKLLMALDHKNIVKYVGTDFPDKHTLHIFLEYVPGGSIESMVQKYQCFEEKLTQIYTKQILTGLAYIHAQNVLHRDIKGANILVDGNGVAKLADFGASRDINDHVASQTGGVEASLHGTVTGTPLWMAPEVVEEKGYGKKADIYSVGATVMEMLTGLPPNSHIKNFAALVRFWDKGGVVEIPSHLSPLAKDFLSKCLSVNPNDRPSAEELLNHPWLADSSLFNDMDTTASLSNSFSQTISGPSKDSDDESDKGPQRMTATIAVPVASDDESDSYSYYSGDEEPSDAPVVYDIVIADANVRRSQETAAALASFGAAKVWVANDPDSAINLFKDGRGPRTILLIDELFPPVSQTKTKSFSVKGGEDLAMHLLTVTQKLPIVVFMAESDFVVSDPCASVIRASSTMAAKVIQRPPTAASLTALLYAGEDSQGDRGGGGPSGSATKPSARSGGHTTGAGPSGPGALSGGSDSESSESEDGDGGGAGSGGSGRQGPKLSVIIANDHDDEVTHLSSLAVNGLGAHVVVVRTVAEAISLSEQPGQPFELALVSANFPPIDTSYIIADTGAQLALSLKQKKKAAKIVLTAASDVTPTTAPLGLQFIPRLPAMDDLVPLFGV